MPKPPKSGQKRPHKVKICVSIAPELIAKVKRIAKRERRSVSSLIEYLIDLEYAKLKAEQKPQDPRTDSGIYRLGGSTVAAVP